MHLIYKCSFYNPPHCLFCICKTEKLSNTNIKLEDINMKGYVVANGYMGYLDGEYILFADEQDYREVFEEN